MSYTVLATVFFASAALLVGFVVLHLARPLSSRARELWRSHRQAVAFYALWFCGYRRGGARLDHDRTAAPRPRLARRSSGRFVIYTVKSSARGPGYRGVALATGRFMFATRVLPLAASVALTLAACGGDPGGTQGAGTTKHDDAICGAAELQIVGGLQLARPADFLGLADFMDQHNEAPPTWIDQTGVACATANDRAACLERVSALSKEPSGALTTGASGRIYRLIGTRGDEVFAVAKNEAVAFVGTIDSAQEAALVLLANGYEVACVVQTGTAASARSTSDGFVVNARYLSDGCDPNGFEQREVLVRRDGTLTVLSHSIIPLGGSRAGCTGK